GPGPVGTEARSDARLPGLPPARLAARIGEQEAVMPRRRISRRTVLRGALGGLGISVALPPLESMFNGNGDAYADGTAIPKRMGIFFWGNGVKPDRWTPTTTGANWAATPSLMPLFTAGVNSYVNVVSGTTITSGDERGHHSGTVGILSGAPLVSQPAGGAPYR